MSTPITITRDQLTFIIRQLRINRQKQIRKLKSGREDLVDQRWDGEGGASTSEEIDTTYALLSRRVNEVAKQFDPVLDALHAAWRTRLDHDLTPRKEDE